MYKPNFCAECGEKITRRRWRVWTSRSFCPGCEGRFRRARILVPVITAAALLSIGLVMGRATRTQQPPLTLQRMEVPSATLASSQAGSDGAGGGDVEDGADTSSSSAGPGPEPKYGPNGTATERPTDPDEAVLLCGARTQKGTPCRRRVRGTGRCWQHRGI